MSAIWQFAGGDDPRQPFLLERSDGQILDLTGLNVSGAVRWGGRSRIPLVAGVQIEIQENAPERAPAEEVQVPHGYVQLRTILGVSFSDLIPVGNIGRLRMTVVRIVDGVKMSTHDFPMERVE